MIKGLYIFLVCQAVYFLPKAENTPRYCDCTLQEDQKLYRILNRKWEWFYPTRLIFMRIKMNFHAGFDLHQLRQNLENMSTSREPFATYTFFCKKFISAQVKVFFWKMALSCPSTVCWTCRKVPMLNFSGKLGAARFLHWCSFIFKMHVSGKILG